jgi:hypothetical protein
VFGKFWIFLLGVGCSEVQRCMGVEANTPLGNTRYETGLFNRIEEPLTGGWRVLLRIFSGVYAFPIFGGGHIVVCEVLNSMCTKNRSTSGSFGVRCGPQADIFASA